MRIVTTLPMDDLKKAGPAAKALEAAGYDGVMTMENAHHPFLPLAVAAVATERVELLTAVAIAFPRSPMVCANAGWGFASRLGRAVRVGLGSPDPCAQRAPFQRALERPRSQNARIRGITPHDMERLEEWGKTRLPGRTLPVHPHDARLHAAIRRAAHGARHHRGGGAGHAQGCGTYL